MFSVRIPLKGLLVEYGNFNARMGSWECIRCGDGYGKNILDMYVIEGFLPGSFDYRQECEVSALVEIQLNAVRSSMSNSLL